jgi:hypothetical protein
VVVEESTIYFERRNGGMARFRMTIEEAEKKTVITYGWDRAVGFFCTAVRGRERLVNYDGLEPGYDGLQGLIDALMRYGVFAEETVQEVLEWLPHVEELDEFEEPEQRQFGELILNLKQAAAE